MYLVIMRPLLHSHHCGVYYQVGQNWQINQRTSLVGGLVLMPFLRDYRHQHDLVCAHDIDDYNDKANPQNHRSAERGNADPSAQL